MLVFTPKDSNIDGQSDVGFWGDGETDIISLVKQATPDMLFPIKKKHIVLKKQIKHTKQAVQKKRYLQRFKGGSGSGFTSEAGHAGIPGHQGGSQLGGSSNVDYSDDPANFVGRFIDAAHEFENAQDLKALSALKRKYLKLADNNLPGQISDGALHYFYTKHHERIAIDIAPQSSSADARARRILSTSDSSGRRRGRKWN